MRIYVITDGGSWNGCLISNSDEDKAKTTLNTSDDNQTVIVINERGLYALLFAMQPQKANKGMSNAYPHEIQQRMESLKAEKRKSATQFGGNGNISTTTGTTRDIVASKLGIGSGKQYEREKYIVENQSPLSPEDFADWDEGKLSTNKAFKG